MGPFLRLLQRSPAPELAARDFEREVGGTERLALLTRQGLVVRASPATSWPCGGVKRELECPRIIERQGTDGSEGYLAVCPSSPRRCESVQLSAKDLEMLTSSTTGLVSLLRRLLDLQPGPRPDLSSGPARNVLPLGMGGSLGTHRDMFLALAPLDPSFLTFLADRRSARMRSIVLVPSAWRLPISVLDRHGPADHVEILCVDKLLTVKGDDVVLAASLETAISTTPPLPSQPPAEPFCRIVDPDGRRKIDATKYRQILADPQYAMVLDLAVMTKKGYLVYVQDGTRRVQRLLTRNGALILGELMFSGQPTTTDRLTWTDLEHPLKVFQRSRALVEKSTTKAKRSAKEPQRSFAWKLFQASSVADPDSAELSFGPPEGFRFALLLSLQDIYVQSKRRGR